ncbi:hypothetical protein F2Q69_00015211 [Brassica cretica]|uniref:Uncharacterized protein n=1 Tax=Brassica cretica TaxID=69181 RepID=A0A8S9QMU3_BRACR|nr:hypothetical protein F2Q69_00015211 [Brassica cretica]
MQFSSYIEVLDDHQHVEASQRGLRCRDEVDKGRTEAASVDTDQIPSNDTINRHRSTLQLHHRFTLDAYQSRKRYHHAIRQVWGKKRRNWKKRKRIKDGPQVKKKDPRKMSLHEDRRWLRNINRQSISSIDRSLLNSVDRQSFKSIDRHLSVLADTHIKIRVRSRCFSQPFAKLRALLMAEMIDKGEESMEEAFTQE